MQRKSTFGVRLQVPCGARVLAAAACALSLASPAAAQGAKPSVPVPAHRDVRSGFGTGVVAGELWGAGPEYKVRFAPDAVEFTPALGRLAEHDLPLTLSTLDVVRGVSRTPAAAAQPQREGDAAVSYVRAPGVTERHELAQGGSELSFVFDAPPAGAGDLVVRLHVSTELVAHESADGLVFEQPGVGGVGLGAVTGRDAAGHSVPGSLQLHGDVLQLALPADFVDSASYPLVLDPYIYPVQNIAVDAFAEEGEPDAAFIHFDDRYMVVWDKVYSITDIDIRGQFLDGAGNIVPGYWLLDISSTTIASHPAVASLPAHNRFMAVWEQRDCFFCFADVYGCSVSTAGFGQSTTIPIAYGGSTNHLHPDIGGHSKGESNVCSVVWEQDGNIFHRNVFVWYPVDPDIAANIETITLGNASAPAISKSGGDDMQLLVVYQRYYSSPAPGDHDIEATLIDVVGNIVIPSFAVSTTIGPDERDPDVDGDGHVFSTVYSRAPNLSSTWNGVYATRTAQFGGSMINTSEYTVDDQILTGLDSREPAVAYTGDGFTVAWSRQYLGTDYDIALVGLDAYANTLADDMEFADYNSTFAHLPALVAKYSSGHLVGDGALCTWQVTYDSGDDDVFSAAIDPQMGVVTDLGGKTPLGGKASVSAATVGNPGFTHFYDGVYSFNSVTLVLSTTLLNVPYCTGKLVPSPDFYFGLVTGLDTTIILPTPMPDLPALLGVTLYEQYSEKDLFSSPCSKKIQLSNGISILIE